jgi:hypothetical protein
MKKSLMSRALFVTLIAVAVAGSGCERRGRAPKEKKASDDVSLTSGTGKKTGVDAPGNGGSGEGEQKKEDKTLTVSEAEWKCEDKGYRIAQNDNPTLAEFKDDIEKIDSFYICAKKNGIVLFLNTSKPASSEDADDAEYTAMIVQEHGKYERNGKMVESNGLLEEYMSLAKSKGNNDDARRILRKRLAAARSMYSNFAAKYARFPVLKDKSGKEFSTTREQRQMVLAIAAADEVAPIVEGTQKTKSGAELVYVNPDGSKND